MQAKAAGDYIQARSGAVVQTDQVNTKLASCNRRPDPIHSLSFNSTRLPLASHADYK
jgi:hypothetical protein